MVFTDINVSTIVAKLILQQSHFTIKHRKGTYNHKTLTYKTFIVSANLFARTVEQAYPFRLSFTILA